MTAAAILISDLGVIMDKSGNQIRRYNTRSSIAPSNEPAQEKFPKKKQIPFVKYTGKIKYFTESMEIAEASDSIMRWVDKQIEAETVPIAFDMEWPFSFQCGPGKSAVIQLCPEEKICFVFHLTNLKKIPPALTVLLKHPKVRLHGVNIKNDFRKLQRDFPEVDADALIENCIDLGVWCNEVLETGGRWSLERLAEFICGLNIDKNKKVRMSKWNIIPLNEEQKMYAAIDVYVGQLIYREIEKRQKIKAKNEADFLNENGGRALKIRKALGEKFL